LFRSALQPTWPSWSALGQFDAGKNVELITGNLHSRDDCRKAAEGISIILHVATAVVSPLQKSAFVCGFSTEYLGLQ